MDLPGIVGRRPQATGSPAGERLPRRGLGPIIAVACWAYLLAAVAVWATIYRLGERWWPATLLLFGPRWVCGLPIVGLLPLAAVARRRSLWVLAAAAGVVVGPVMGLCLPWRRWMPAPPTGRRLRMMTCNVHGPAARRQALSDLIDAAHPDLVAVEEWEGGSRVPLLGGRRGVPGRPWYALDDGELHVEGRYPMRKAADVVPADAWGNGAAVRLDLLLPGGAVPVIVVHLASPHTAIRRAVRLGSRGATSLAGNDDARRRQAVAVGRAAAAAGPAVVCLGDFNLPADSESYRLGLSPLSDAFANGGGLGFGWTYRVRWTATRIDHVLLGPAWRSRHCWVGPDVGSPHRPLLADLDGVTPHP